MEICDRQSDGQMGALGKAMCLLILMGGDIIINMFLKGYPLEAKIVSMIRKYHNHKLQTTPWYPEEEPLNHHETPGKQIKQSNQLSLSHQDDCNTRMDIK